MGGRIKYIQARDVVVERIDVLNGYHQPGSSVIQIHFPKESVGITLGNHEERWARGLRDGVNFKDVRMINNEVIHFAEIRRDAHPARDVVGVLQTEADS